MSKIKRSVSMYSLQDEYLNGRMNLEDIFKFLEQMEVEGIEFISDQMLHNSPHPSDEDLKEWDRLVKKYSAKPVCNDIFINTCLYKNRTLTTRESTALLIDEIKLANRLGFNLVRLVSMTPPEIIEPALPYAEKYNVTLALEIHAGMSFDHPMTKAFISEIHRLKSPYLGIVVDMGIFCRKHPRVSTNYFKNLGLHQEVADYIDNIFASGKDPKSVFAGDAFGSSEHDGIQYPPELQKLIKNETDAFYAMFSTGYESSDLSILDEHLPYIKHFHGKIYEMTEDMVEYSIPYKEIIEYLDKKGYDGYISTEYEGNRFTLPGEPMQEKEQIRRHQAMLKKYIDELNNN